MQHFVTHRSVLVSCLLMLAVLGCSAGPSAGPNQKAATKLIVPAARAKTEQPGQIASLSIDVATEDAWQDDWEAAFQQRAEKAIAYFADQGYGNTHGENEKRSYPYAMFDFLAGNREPALAFLQKEDNQAHEHSHTLGIDYYYSFTLKGQIRKYFHWGEFLDPDYRQRMFEGAKRWTEQDPNGRPHPVYGNGDDSGKDWDISRRGGWVDSRNTDNLRAMREVAVYLMAEETGNEAVRQQYQQKLQRYVWALYNIGMGEWDSENYHGHTLAAYLNLYDFAQAPAVKQLAKAALDWLSAAGAVKYYRGGFGGPIKRDHGKGSVVFGSAAARLLWQYFGDAVIENPEPERDAIHVITSGYRPPAAVVALAHKEFEKPLELLSSKPVYENWKPGKGEQPHYWETTFFGHTYQMGSVVSKFADGDVGPFKLMAENTDRGIDYFVANTGKQWVQPGKKSGDQMGQYQNLLIWLRPATDTAFCFQIPKTAKAEIEAGIWFFQLENTWLAVHPINLGPYEMVEITKEKVAKRYRDELTLKSAISGGAYSGFALEVGEKQSHGSYERFKAAVKQQSQLDLKELSKGTVQLNSTTGTTLKLTHNTNNERPTVVRNGTMHDWSKHWGLYQPTNGEAPISLGWQQGKLRVNAGGFSFESTVLAN
ncbi:MAG: hypothetical protein F6K19_11750 [Cyanothece sp. SIO1E1]|nr:hypothetical protein [Cyanothece sp. SIO1E1]